MSRFCPFLPDGNPRAFNQPVVTDRCDRVMFTFPKKTRWLRAPDSSTPLPAICRPLSLLTGFKRSQMLNTGAS